MSTQLACAKCGTPLPANARFCEKCGASIASPVPATAPPLVRAQPPVAAPPSTTNRGLIIGLVIAGGLIALVCLAIGVFGFWFMQSKPATPVAVPVITSQVGILPTNVPPPAATAVRPPTSASLATSTPSLPAGVLFLDDFASKEVSQRNGWTLTSDDVADRTWLPNQYTISVKKQNYFVSAAPNGEYDNLGIEAEAQVVSSGYAEYGLLFRSSKIGDTFSYYLFGITTDGKYYLDKKIGGKWIDPSPVAHTPSQFINQGKNKNTLGVNVQGNTISLFINRIQVQTLTDDSITGKGNAGLVVQMGDKDVATVAFSRFTVYTPDKAKAEWCPPPATALPSGILLDDDFGSARVSACNGWDFPRLDYADALWSPNTYTISVKKPNSGGVATMDNAGREYTDFALETEAQPLDDNVSVYGIVFRARQNPNGTLFFYRFALITNGEYSFYKSAVDGWTRVVANTPSPLIKTGKNKNTLGVIAQGNTFSLYINRTLVKTITDDSIKGSGWVGITAGNEANAPAAASFSRVTVLTPDKARADWGGASVSSTPPVVASSPPTVPPTLAARPGLYVTAVRLDPGPKRGADITFFPKFLNTTGGTQTYRAKVYIYNSENLSKSTGETSAGNITIPVGTTEQQIAGSWKSGVGGCQDFVIRVGWIDEANRITFFNKPDGNIFESYASVCP